MTTFLTVTVVQGKPDIAPSISEHPCAEVPPLDDSVLQRHRIQKDLLISGSETMEVLDCTADQLADSANPGPLDNVLQH